MFESLTYGSVTDLSVGLYVVVRAGAGAGAGLILGSEERCLGRGKWGG